MAFNPTPQVSVARDYAKRFGQTHVVILFINTENGTVGYSSYGRNARECAQAKAIGDVLYETVGKAIESGRIKL